MLHAVGGEACSIWDEDGAQIMPYKNKAREDSLHIVYCDEASPVLNSYVYKVLILIFINMISHSPGKSLIISFM